MTNRICAHVLPQPRFYFSMFTANLMMGGGALNLFEGSIQNVSSHPSTGWLTGSAQTCPEHPEWKTASAQTEKRVIELVYYRFTTAFHINRPLKRTEKECF